MEGRVENEGCGMGVLEAWWGVCPGAVTLRKSLGWLFQLWETQWMSKSRLSDL